MGRRTYYYRCPCGKRWWDYLESATPVPGCPECGSLSAVEEFWVPALVGTSKAFVEAHGRRIYDDPVAREHFKRKAEAAGVSTAGRVYLTELATEPGDVEAWVPEHDAKDAARALCRRRGWGCEALGVTSTNPPPPDKPVGLAQDIVDHLVDEAVTQDPGLPIRKSREAIEGDIRDKHTPEFAKRPRSATAGKKRKSLGQTIREAVRGVKS
jgi:hypothetical protein